MRRAGNRRSGGHHHVRKSEEEGQLSDGCEYALGVSDDSNASSDGKIPVKIGGLVLAGMSLVVMCGNI